METKKLKSIPVQDLFNASAMKNGVLTFQFLKKTSAPSVQGRGVYPPFTLIPTSDYIYDDVNKMNREIRYAPGEISVFADEQSDLAVDRAKNALIMMKDGALVVHETEALLMEYLLGSNYYVGNPKRRKDKSPIFKLKDARVDAATTIEKEKQITDVHSYIYNMPLEEAKAYAIAYDIHDYQSLSLSEMKWHILNQAHQNRQRFDMIREDKSMVMKVLAIKCFDTETLEENNKRSTIDWGRDVVVGSKTYKKGDVLTHIPVQGSYIKHLSRYLLDEENVEILNALRAQVRTDGTQAETLPAEGSAERILYDAKEYNIIQFDGSKRISFRVDFEKLDKAKQKFAQGEANLLKMLNSKSKTPQEKEIHRELVRRIQAAKLEEQLEAI